MEEKLVKLIELVKLERAKNQSSQQSTGGNSKHVEELQNKLLAAESNSTKLSEQVIIGVLFILTRKIGVLEANLSHTENLNQKLSREVSELSQKVTSFESQERTLRSQLEDTTKKLQQMQQTSNSSADVISCFT